MGKKARIDAVLQYARKERDKTLRRKPSLSPSVNYRWGHTLRVVQRGMALAKKEDADVEKVVAACILHDIAKLSNTSHDLEHGRIGAKKVRPVLQKIGYKKKEVDAISYAIAVHVDGKADFKYENTLEADVVSDADKLDRFSVYRTMLRLKSQTKSQRNYLLSVRRELSRLKEYRKNHPMRTASGKKLFLKQLDLQIAFLEQLLVDNDLTVLPKL